MNLSIGEKIINEEGIIINNFNLVYGEKVLYKDTSIKLLKGGRYGFIGENGKGKSSILKVIKDIYINNTQSINILYVNQEFTELELSPFEILDSVNKDNNYYQLKIRQEEIEKIFNEIDLDENKMEVLTEELDYIENELKRLNPERERHKIKSILNGLGFEDLNIKSKFLSGGWQSRINIAKALYLEPDVLMLDEPTNHLDLEAIIWLGDYLEKYNENKILVIVSHNIGFINSVCNNIINIETINSKQSLCYYKGNYSKFKIMFDMKVRNLENEHQKYLKRIKEMKKNNKKKSFIDDYILKNKVDIIKQNIGLINFKDLNSESNIHNNIHNNIISVDNLTFGYDNILFENLSFGLDLNSKVILAGKNGCGKSTLLKLIMDNNKNNNITINSKIKIGYYTQHFENNLPNDKTPTEYLTNLFNIESLEVRKILGRVKLEASHHLKLISELSGGQKARVAIAKLMLEENDFLILDEPTNHLDITTVDVLIDGLKMFNGGLLIVTHETELIEQEGFELWVLEDKKIKKMEYQDYYNSILNNLAYKN
jgi:ATPase subunit of ABC transporter with duplicated ATPase domains